MLINMYVSLQSTHIQKYVFDSSIVRLSLQGNVKVCLQIVSVHFLNTTITTTHAGVRAYESHYYM